MLDDPAPPPHARPPIAVCNAVSLLTAFMILFWGTGCLILVSWGSVGAREPKQDNASGLANQGLVLVLQTKLQGGTLDVGDNWAGGRKEVWWSLLSGGLQAMVCV